MADRFQYRDGKLLMQRIGSLTPVRQRNLERLGDPSSVQSRRNPRAPENRGLWAFPFPFFDSFFAAHHYEMALPKRLQAETFQAQFTEEQEPTREDYDRLYQQRNDYYRSPAGRQRLRVRKFWVSGELYTHIDVHDADSEWIKMSVSQFVQRLPKLYAQDLGYANNAWGQWKNWRPDGKAFMRHTTHGPWPLSVDHLEIFLGRGATIH